MARIHTLNARGNVMLPVLREYFSWTDARTFREIQRFHEDLLDILKAKGIDYELLRSALTPQQTKHEAAFLFDEQRCDNEFIPGVECADALFKLLHSKATHSILGGDLIDNKDEIARKCVASSTSGQKANAKMWWLSLTRKERPIAVVREPISDKSW